jgi:heme exporter protein B
MLMQASGTVFSTTAVIPIANILLLVASNGLVILLSVVLFPFLWRD